MYISYLCFSVACDNMSPTSLQRCSDRSDAIEDSFIRQPLGVVTYVYKYYIQ